MKVGKQTLNSLKFMTDIEDSSHYHMASVRLESETNVKIRKLI